MDEFLKLAVSGYVDAIVDVFPPMGKDPDGLDIAPHLRMKEWLSLPSRPFWIIFDAVPGDCLTSIKNEEQLFGCDLFILRSQYWVDYYVRAMSSNLSEYIWEAKKTVRLNGKFILKLLEQWQNFRWKEQHVEYFRKRTKCIGYPMLDPVATIDRDKVRRSFNIPRDIPVIVHLPNPYGHAWGALWEKMYVTRRMPIRLAWAMMSGRRDYVCNALAASDDGSVVDAIGRFCKKNNAFLVSKRRHSQCASPQVKKNAALVVGDLSQYPHTMVSLLSVADMCIGSYSSTVYEAAAEGAFFLNINIPFFPVKLYEVYFPILEVYNYNGVAASMDADCFVNEFSNMGLNDFKIKPESHRAFCEKYIGQLDGHSSARFVDRAEELCVSRRRSNG